MVALLVVGIASSSDTRQVGRLGLRAVATFYSLLGAVAILIALVAPPLFAGLRLDPTRVAALRANAAGADALTAQVPSFRDWLVSLVPTNPIGAAAEGALLPLIVFVVAFGFALTRVDAPEREHAVGSSAPSTRRCSCSRGGCSQWRQSVFSRSRLSLAISWGLERWAPLASMSQFR